MKSLEAFLLGDEESEPEPEKEADPLALVVKDPLPDKEYTCSKCGKTYRAIFLMKPVNDDCTKCFYGRRK